VNYQGWTTESTMVITSTFTTSTTSPQPSTTTMMATKKYSEESQETTTMNRLDGRSTSSQEINPTMKEDNANTTQRPGMRTLASSDGKKPHNSQIAIVLAWTMLAVMHVI